MSGRRSRGFLILSLDPEVVGLTEIGVVRWGGEGVILEGRKGRVQLCLLVVGVMLVEGPRDLGYWVAVWSA